MANYKTKTKLQADAGILLPQETVQRVLTTDANGDIKSSGVSTTTLSYLDATSSVQDQLNTNSAAISSAQDEIDALVALSGVAAGSEDLGSFTGTIIPDGSTNKEALQSLETAIDTLPDPIYYAGTWDASTNTPTLSNTDTDMNGALYQVNVAGSHDFGAGSISFEVGDKVVNNGTIWEKWDHTDQVLSVNGQQGVVQLDAEDVPYDNTASGLAATELQGAVDELAADIAAIPASYISSVSDTSSVDLEVSAGALSATVLPGGVDHDALLNFVANEHIDHTAVSINTAANSGLSGGGNIAASRSLTVDIIGTTASTVADNADSILIYDSSAAALRSQTRANFLAGLGSPGDIAETSFSGANNQAVLANVTGFAFSNAVVRSFTALVSVYVDATADLFETFTLNGVQKGASWDLSVTSTGDDSDVNFDITAAGQLQYQSGNAAGFTALTIKFRAITTSA